MSSYGPSGDQAYTGSMGETQVSHSEEPQPEPLASSTETTAIAGKVGEHEVKLEQAQSTAEQAAATAASAASAAEAAAASSVHSHEEYATKSDLAGLGDRLASVLEDRLPKAPESTPPPAVEQPPDDAPKSRERKAKKKSLADRFYGRT